MFSSDEYQWFIYIFLISLLYPSHLNTILCYSESRLLNRSTSELASLFPMWKKAFSFLEREYFVLLYWEDKVRVDNLEITKGSNSMKIIPLAIGMRVGGGKVSAT